VGKTKKETTIPVHQLDLTLVSQVKVSTSVKFFYRIYEVINEHMLARQFCERNPTHVKCKWSCRKQTANYKRKCQIPCFGLRGFYNPSAPTLSEISLRSNLLRTILVQFDGRRPAYPFKAPTRHSLRACLP
jgi:hypothetical protein